MQGNFTLITGSKPKEEASIIETPNENGKIAFFDELLTQTIDEKNHVQWFEIPFFDISPSSENYDEKYSEWLKICDKGKEKIEALEYKIGAIYERAEKELAWNNYKKLLRHRHIKIAEAKEKIEAYQNLRINVKKGIGHITLYNIEKSSYYEEPMIELFRAWDKSYTIAIRIAYDNEEEAINQLKEAFQKFHYYENMVNGIDREVRDQQYFENAQS